MSESLPPIVRRKGQGWVRAQGMQTGWWRDFYHRAISLPWPVFLGMGAVLYLGGNLVFALLYLAQAGSIAHAEPGSFADAFFFSVQTMATIGYGVLSPGTLYGNVIVTAETLFGMLLLGLVSGLTFARVSRPTARVMFASRAVVTRYDGVPTLMVRLANQRSSHVVQAEVSFSLLRNERSREGVFMRRFHDLRLARARTPVFALSFTVMHPIGPDSPLHGLTPADLHDIQAELVVSVTGLDGVMLQTIHARTSYMAAEIIWDHHYADIFGPGNVLNYRAFHEIVADQRADAAPTGRAR